MAFLPKTTSRVHQSTADAVNLEIQRETERNVERFDGSNKETIAKRLEELDREWDIERTMETGASAHILAGLLLAVFVNRRFLLWSGLVAGFVMAHALFGWFPALPFLRRLGVRTQAEIDEERVALRIMRGDFGTTEDAKAALAQTRLSFAPTITGASLADQK